MDDRIYTENELTRMNIDTLDMMAFGIKRCRMELPWQQIHIVHRNDYSNAVAKFKRFGMKWARECYANSRNEPVEVAYRNYRFELENGHHRFYAARKLNKPLICDIEVKMNPVVEILNRQKARQPVAPPQPPKEAKMNWYKVAQSTYQDGWTDTFGDIQRYALDPYRAQVFLTKTSQKITVSVTIAHEQFGLIVWQDFWSFPLNKESEAKKTYGKVHDAVQKIFSAFRGDETPNNMLHTTVREAVRHIDPQYKPDSRVPWVNWARNNDGVSDWRGSIYGVRYPDQSGF